MKLVDVLVRCMVVGAAGLLASCGKEKPAASPPPAAPVSVLTLQARTAPAVFEFVGQTESSQQVEVRARVTGFLEKRIYTEGSVVKAGDKLFLIDTKPFNASLAAAQGELALQQARLSTARANLARVKPLVNQNALSQRDLDDATGQEQAAAAAVEAAQAKVETARLDLGYATVTSPVAGLTSFAKVQDGAYVDATNSLLTYVARLDPMRVNFSLSENEVLRWRAEQAKGTLIAQIERDNPVEIVMADGSTYPHQGHITFSDAAFSQETGTFLVRAELPNPDGVLRPGQFVRVRVLGYARPHAIVVPQRAVQQGPRGTFVWLADADGKAQQRNVEVGDWLGDNWVIASGLKAGERVVVDGALKLAPGAPLKASAASAPELASRTAKARPIDEAEKAANLSTEGGKEATGARSGSAPPVATEAAVHFALGSANLDATGRQLLLRVAQTAQGSGKQVIVSGHADASGDAALNERLAKARAEAVAQALQTAGLPATRVVLSKPGDVASGQGEAARRVDLSLAVAP